MQVKSYALWLQPFQPAREWQNEREKEKRILVKLKFLQAFWLQIIRKSTFPLQYWIIEYRYRPDILPPFSLGEKVTGRTDRVNVYFSWFSDGPLNHAKNLQFFCVRDKKWWSLQEQTSRQTRKKWTRVRWINFLGVFFSTPLGQLWASVRSQPGLNMVLEISVCA